jgi:hypothetical protein
LAAKNAIDRAPHGSILVFGDNIVEGAPPLSTICGHAVVNGGVSGATIGYFERHGRTTRIYHPRLIVLAVGINHTSALRTGFNRITTRPSRRFRACRRGGRNGYAGAEWNGGGRLSSGPGPNLRHRHPCNTRDGLGDRSQRTALALTSPRTESILEPPAMRSGSKP